MTGGTDWTASTRGAREFPKVGTLMKQAYVDLAVAETRNPVDLWTGQPNQELPRPWDPASCREPALRREVWRWLDQVVDWINTEYCWTVTGLIPPCWYRHPHLVHDLATVADQRRRASLQETSDQLETWHHDTLPTFLERNRTRMGGACEEGHTEPPGRARLTRYHTLEAVADRQAWFDTEVRDNTTPDREPPDGHNG